MSKFETEKAKALVQLGFPAVEPVIPQILEWLQDLNWPVGHVFQPFLVEIGGPLAPYIRTVLVGDDDGWKYSLLRGVVYESPDMAHSLRTELERVAREPSVGEAKEEVDLVAIEILEVLNVACSNGSYANMDTAKAYLDAIVGVSDLDDPREMYFAQKFMIDALYRVTPDLPPAAREAAAVANRYSTGVASEKDLEEERVRLWSSISGRDQSDDIDVLRTRAALLVLFPPVASETCDSMASFLTYWFRSGLSESKLSAVLQNDYGLTINSGRTP